MSPNTSLLDSIIKNLKKKHGENSLLDFTNKKDKMPGIETISTGLPSLDLILGGGVPKGRIMEVFGLPSGGKSTLAMHMLAKCQSSQKTEDGKVKRVVYLDLENSFDPIYATSLGLNVDDMIYIRPDNGEMALDMVEKLATPEVSAIVLDSISALVPMANIAKEIDGSVHIATTARLLSANLPRINMALGKSGTVLICINQLRALVGSNYGPTEATPGGFALKYFSSIRLKVSSSKAEERNGEEGNPVKIRVEKNKIAPPFRKTELFLVYAKGFDYYSDIVTSALVAGIIEQGGAWFNYKDIKAQGIESLKDQLREKPEYLESLEKTLSEIKL